MTEAEWLSGADPEPMLVFLRGKVSDRKLRLFAVACYRHLLPLFHGENKDYGPLHVAERQADGLEVPAELLRRDRKVRYNRDYVGTAAGQLDAFEAALDASRAARNEVRQRADYWDDQGGYNVAEWFRPASAAGLRVAEAQARAQAECLRDIFGNPFRPVIAEPGWRRVNAVALARAIYEERAFERLPVLADALLDAGCADEQVLGHCRSDEPHVRGCWVIDLLLGKQ